MFRIVEIELRWKIRSESRSKPMSEFGALFFTFAKVSTLLPAILLPIRINDV